MAVYDITGSGSGNKWQVRRDGLVVASFDSKRAAEGATRQFQASGQVARYVNRTFLCGVCGYLRRARSPDFKSGEKDPAWPKHCGTPMLLLGYRASQAATCISETERVTWAALGCRFLEHEGKKRWRPILSKRKLKDAYPDN